MGGPLYLAVSASAGDQGIRGIAALSARLSYTLMCLTICWGIFTTTGWVRRLSGREPLRGGHMVLATLTLAFAGLHALAFLFLRDVDIDLLWISIPFIGGSMARHSLGIVGLEVMLAIAISAGMRRWLAYRSWLRLHQFAYPAFGLTVLHSMFGALANGTASTLWLAGLTLFVPPLTLTALRFLPPKYLAKIGLLTAEPVAPANAPASKHQVVVSVDNVRCNQYGYCQAEAPEVFEIAEDGRLRYEPRPHQREAANARAAERVCPMRAIDLKERQS